MSELSRAQVEELAQRAVAWTDGVEIAAWLETDAALRTSREVERTLYEARLAALELANSTLQYEVTKLEKMLYPGGT